MHKLIALTIAIFFCAPVVGAQVQQPCKPPAPLVVSREQNIFTKEGDYFLQVLDARAGTTVGRLLIETGKGPFLLSRVIVDGDWVVTSDPWNRVLIYSLSSGEKKGKVFGSRAIINPSGKLLCVENEAGQLTIYDLVSMEKRDQFVFSNPIAVARFTPEGNSLFVLTANQTAYFLDVSALIR